MKKLLLPLCALLSGTLGAQNLIVDSDCKQGPASGEFTVSENAVQGKLSKFTEEDGNTCLKFELVKCGADKNGKKRVGTGILIGGDKKLQGFPCKPDTVYKFTVKVKGEAARAMFNVFEWDNLKDNNWRSRRKFRASIHLIQPKAEWTEYSGTFKTGPKAKRAALGLQFWGDEARKDFQEKEGQYILVDHIVIEEVKP